MKQKIQQAQKSASNKETSASNKENTNQATSQQPEMLKRKLNNSKPGDHKLSPAMPGRYSRLKAAGNTGGPGAGRQMNPHGGGKSGPRRDQPPFLFPPPLLQTRRAKQEIGRARSDWRAASFSGRGSIQGEAGKHALFNWP